MKIVNNKQVVAILFMVFVIGFAAGFIYGANYSLQWALKIAEHFLTIEIDEKEIASAMFQYKNNINNCYNG